jgi:hypothetical protein
MAMSTSLPGRAVWSSSRFTSNPPISTPGPSRFRRFRSCSSIRRRILSRATSCSGIRHRSRDESAMRRSSSRGRI